MWSHPECPYYGCHAMNTATILTSISSDTETLSVLIGWAIICMYIQLINMNKKENRNFIAICLFTLGYSGLGFSLLKNYSTI